MHPIDEFAMPLLVLGAIVLGIVIGVTLAVAEYRKRKGEQDFLSEPLPAYDWERHIAWRDYFAGTRPDPATDLR